MSKLTEDIKWLKAKDNRRFEIYDAETEILLRKGISAAEIIEKYGDFKQFIEYLKGKGHSKIAIQKAHKHGAGQIRDGITHKYALAEQQPKSQLVAGGGQAQAAPSTNIPQNPAGLMGTMSQMGLGFSDVMRMNTEAENYRNEKEKADRLQRKIEKLEADNKQLERDNLRYELGVEAKPGAMEKLLDTVSNNPELLTSAIQALSQAKQPATAALNAPSSDNQVSKLKAALIQALRQDTVSDELAMMIYHVIRQSSNEPFMTSFRLLLEEYLKPNSNETD